jgi:hypothetical protein
MKNAITLFTLLLISFYGFSQTSDFTLTFEDTAVINRVYYTDSVLDPAGIWQIGAPTKPLFDSGYFFTHAVVTLLDSALPANSKASFIVKISSNIYQGYLVTFRHKFDFDSAKGGGYVEFSIDSGDHWHPVQKRDTSILDPCYLGWLNVDGQYINVTPPTWWQHLIKDTTPSGIPYYTGTDSTWVQDTIMMPRIAFGKRDQGAALLFRFTAFADSNSLPKAGWIIDDINVHEYIVGCGGGINDINSSHLTISPNPVESGFSISLTDQLDNNYTVTLLDLTGREMMTRDFTGREVTLHRDGLAAGSYIVKMTNVRTEDSFEKRVVFE